MIFCLMKKGRAKGINIREERTFFGQTCILIKLLTAFCVFNIQKFEHGKKIVQSKILKYLNS